MFTELEWRLQGNSRIEPTMKWNYATLLEEVGPDFGGPPLKVEKRGSN
jgi:hypothetical protein